MTENLQENKARAKVKITGIVQGVNYRWQTLRQAQVFGINGWVRNMDNGSVEACFEGEKEEVERMIEWCKIGPSGASVEEVEVEWEKYKSEFRSFSITR